jgi:hypothetical protein
MSRVEEEMQQMAKVSMFRVLMFASLAPLALATSAAAQAEAGDSEIQAYANFSMVANNADTANGTISFNYGKFLTDVWQLGGGPTINIAKGDPVDVTTGVNGFVRRYFGAARVQPYVGGEIFLFDVTDADFTYGNIIAGIKNYFSERAAIDFKGGYGILLKEPGEPGLISFQVGLTVLF